MTKLLFTTLSLTLSSLLFSQNPEIPTALNLDFELTENGMPRGWNSFGSQGYKLSIDSLHKKSGKYGASIQFEEGNLSDYKAISLILPNNYAGKRITLSGYVKTENVNEGYAGLWMRIDPSIAL